MNQYLTFTRIAKKIFINKRRKLNLFISSIKSSTHKQVNPIRTLLKQLICFDVNVASISTIERNDSNYTDKMASEQVALKFCIIFYGR